MGGGGGIKLKISPGKVVEVGGGGVKVKVSPEWEMESKGFT